MGLKQFGRELVKANFGNALTQLVDPSSWRGTNALPARRGSLDFYGVGGFEGTGFFSYDGLQSSLIAYEKCPPLQSVVNRRALALINGVLKVKNSLDKESNSATARKFIAKLDDPNPFQCQDQFLAQISIYLDLIGYAIIVPFGYSRNFGGFIDAESIWVIPPELCSIGSYSNDVNFLTGGIDYIQIGSKRVSPEDVILISAIDPSLRKMIIPGEKIKSLSGPINNIIGAYQTEGNLIKKRGPSGFITNKVNPQLGAPLPLLPDEKARIQNEFNNAYGLLDSQSHIILTNAAMDYVKTGFDRQELGIDESIKGGTIAICDTIGWPTELMGIVNPIKSNRLEAKIEVYQDFIIPFSNSIFKQLSKKFLGKNETAYLDYSHLPVLQQDKEKCARTDKTNTENLIMQFKMNAISMKTFKELSKIEEPKPGDELIYFENIKDIIIVPVGTQNNNNENNNQTN
jgi:hypothetical protein